ncbi:MAG TPA: preprotein translocase subunit SecG [Candidatus Woesebacteria bacterium]|jgi:protein translocase SecG subunit|nr:preprotein translocase subunit SecG [Candidatus Woesebacteria bacterium]
MKTFLIVIQIILSLTLSTLIFLQSSGETESRSNLMNSAPVEKRGWEKVMFNLTIFIIILFIVSSIVQTLI